MVSGLNHLLGRVKRSDLVQSGRDIPRCCGRANTGPGVIHHDNITLWDIPKTLIWAHLGLWKPPEACRGQTKQTMVGIEVKYGILEQVGSVQHVQK